MLVRNRDADRVEGNLKSEIAYSNRVGRLRPQLGNRSAPGLLDQRSVKRYLIQPLRCSTGRMLSRNVWSLIESDLYLNRLFRRSCVPSCAVPCFEETMMPLDAAAIPSRHPDDSTADS